MHGFDADFSLNTLPMRVFGAFHRANHTKRLLMLKIVGQHGGHPSQALCMREIAHQEGISQRDLADRLRLSRPTVTVMLQKLERAGLIQRRADEHDQRFMRLYLTDQGRAQHDNVHAVFGEIIDAALAPMSEADQKELERLLTMLNDNMLAALGADEGKEAR